MTDIDLIWEELLSHFEYSLPESREAFVEEAENVVKELTEYGKISPDEDIKAIMEGLEVRWEDYLKEKKV
jgi:lipoate-protein ligase A